MEVAAPAGILPWSICVQIVGNAIVGKEMSFPSIANISGDLDGQKSLMQSSRNDPSANVTRLSLAKYSPLFLLLSQASQAIKDVN